MMNNSSFERLLKHKNLHHKTVEVEGKEKTFECLGYNTKRLQIWYENERVKKILEKMPNSDAVVEVFEAYSHEVRGGIFQIFSHQKGYSFKSLLIADSQENDNWLYKRSKTWVVTLVGVLTTVVDTLEVQGVDVEPMLSYLREQNVVIREE